MHRSSDSIGMLAAALAKAQAELDYQITPIETAIRDAVADFAARGLVPEAAVNLGAAAQRRLAA